VSIVEGGTLTAVNEVSIRNEVEGVARIIYIVPEGTYVKKGDLLVELDSAQAEDTVNQQRINYEKARFALSNAIAQLEIQRSTTNSDITAAALKLKFAEMDLQRFLEGQLIVDQVEASNKLVSALAQLAVNEETYMYSSNLAARGYETKQRVDADRLSVLNVRNSAIVASNTIWILQKFDLPKLREKYESDAREARRELERIVLQSERRIAQYVADVLAASNTLVLNERQLERAERNLKATKIYAPQDGLVVYPMVDSRFSSESLIEEGATVRNRQELIKLPDTSKMKVTVRVHESHVSMVKPGQRAFVVLDSMPDQRFEGYVEKVALLPDTQARWGNPNLKVYKTEVILEDLPRDIKPGVSARAEILITNIENTLSVPIQAVTTLKGKQVCYVANGNKVTPVPVQVGMFNTKFIQITSGLKEGDRVLLSPPFDTQEKDLEGAVLAAEERNKLHATGRVQRASAAMASTNGPPSAPVSAPARPPQLASGQTEEGSQPPEERPRRPRFNPEQMLKEFDKDGDGQLSESEREAMRETLAARFGAMGGQGGPGGAGMVGGGQRFNREEMLKRFDTNGDGELDETERAAMREAMRGQGGGPRFRPDRQGEGFGGSGASAGGNGAERNRQRERVVPPTE
ncbi:MAG: efflux RND transporter periplasmic adaptor subunit, partial [Verrucomicrobiae bacterium]|nr:efflux RND transporter periplasmic adaptor subunit [Verrucomicrobiae bacterium]